MRLKCVINFKNATVNVALNSSSCIGRKINFDATFKPDYDVLILFSRTQSITVFSRTVAQGNSVKKRGNIRLNTL